MKYQIFAFLLLVSTSVSADWYPYKDWYWTDGEGSARTKSHNQAETFGYVIYLKKQSECYPVFALQLPSNSYVTRLGILVGGEVWTADSPKISVGDGGNKFVFTTIDEDLVTAIKSGSNLAIHTDHVRIEFSLKGSSKTINLAHAVCQGEREKYASYLPSVRHGANGYLRKDIISSSQSTEVSALQDDLLHRFGSSYVVIGEDNITYGYALRAKRKIERSGAELVIVDSNGGLVDEAMSLGRWIRKQGLNTAVAHNCASACVEVLAGGKERLVGLKAQVGIHQINITNPDYDSAEAGQYSVAKSADYFSRMGVDSNIVIARSSVPPEEMKWLTSQELYGWDLSTNTLSDVIASQIPVNAGSSSWKEYEFNGVTAMAQGYNPSVILLWIIMIAGTGIALVKINKINNQ